MSLDLTFIETGTQLGGSAYYLVSLCDLVGNGRVITIDVDPVEDSLSNERTAFGKVRPAHPCISYLRGSSTSDHVFHLVKKSIQKREKALVILDSWILPIERNICSMNCGRLLHWFLLGVTLLWRTRM
jgi:cephalosporin hydroxylase